LSTIKKDSIFIVHGRDNEQALLLQKFLIDELRVDAVRFDDLQGRGKTVIEMLEHIKSNIAHVFVIITPDDIGCLYDEIRGFITKCEGRESVSGETVSCIINSLRKRARQNVIFELGMFIGSLGRDKVSCIVQKELMRSDKGELPRDIYGLIFLPFEKSVSEVFHKTRRELEPN